jgi:Ca2+-binding EF-hand superfamily protein
MLFLLLLALVYSTSTPDPSIDLSKLTANCGGVTFSRKQAIACLLIVVDTNHDGGLSKEEIEALPKKYLHWWERAAIYLKITFGGGDDPMQKIFADCDVDGDGSVTYSDMVNSYKKCIPATNADGSQANGLCDLKSYVCDRAAAEMKIATY